MADEVQVEDPDQTVDPTNPDPAVEDDASSTQTDTAESGASEGTESSAEGSSTETQEPVQPETPEAPDPAVPTEAAPGAAPTAGTPATAPAAPGVSFQCLKVTGAPNSDHPVFQAVIGTTPILCPECGSDQVIRV